VGDPTWIFALPLVITGLVLAFYLAGREASPSESRARVDASAGDTGKRESGGILPVEPSAKAGSLAFPLLAAAFLLGILTFGYFRASSLGADRFEPNGERRSSTTISGSVSQVGFRNGGGFQFHVVSGGEDYSVNYDPESGIPRPSLGEFVKASVHRARESQYIMWIESLKRVLPSTSIRNARVSDTRRVALWSLGDCCSKYEVLRKNRDKSLLVRFTGQDGASYLALLPRSLKKYLKMVDNLGPAGVFTDDHVLIVETLQEGTDGWPDDFVHPYVPRHQEADVAPPFVVGEDGYLYDSMGRVDGYVPARDRFGSGARVKSGASDWFHPDSPARSDNGPAGQEVRRREAQSGW